MKKFNSFLVLVFALLTTQWANAQCTGTISSQGSGASYTFTSTNPTSGMQMHSWDFGDGTYGSGQTATHTYSASGSYSVIAYFGDSINLCTDIDTLIIMATVPVGSSCSAAFTTSGSSPSFTFTPTGTPTAPPGYYSYDWNFGDGSVAWGNNNPSHTYAANGTYTVTCILNDSIWCSDTVTSTVVVTGISMGNCNADFTFTDSLGIYYFNASYPTASSSYVWLLSNGTTYGGSSPAVSISFPGTYVMCLTITDSLNSCMNDTCITFTVLQSGGITCDASFSSTNQGYTYSFTPNTPNTSAAYYWDFGDGSSSTAMSPTHTYATGGNYSVVCSMGVPSSCSDSSLMTINVTTIPTSGTISGVINMGNSYADNGVVFLIAYDTNGILTLVDTTYIDSFGMYFFGNVPFGTYLVKAALSPSSINFTSYLPSYYASGSMGVLLWSNASDAVLNTPYLNNIDIELVAGTNSGGPAFIGGFVNQGANKTGDPISDINIIVYDQNNTPVAYTYSNNQGTFQISNLPFGTYTVYPEVEGRTTTPLNVTLSAGNPGVDEIGVIVNSSTVEVGLTTGIATTAEFTGLNLYPNPVLNELTIDLGELITGEATFSIIDVTGKVIQSISQSGTNVLKMNTSSLNEGIYILNIQHNGQISNYKFVK